MRRYIVRRLLILIPVMLGVSFITFMMMELAPGDPAEIILLKKEIEVTRCV